MRKPVSAPEIKAMARVTTIPISWYIVCISTDLPSPSSIRGNNAWILSKSSLPDTGAQRG